MAGEGSSQLPSDLLRFTTGRLPTFDGTRLRSIFSALHPPPRKFGERQKAVVLTLPLCQRMGGEAAAPTCGPLAPPRPPSEIPWLLLSPSVPDPGSRGCAEELVRFYSICDQRMVNLGCDHLADMAAECRAIVSYSPDGWLMYMDRVCELQCVHLPTGERIQIPSITTLPQVRGAETDSEGHIIGYYMDDLGGDPLRHCDWLFWFYQRGIIIFPGSPPDHLPTTDSNRRHHSTTSTAREYLIVVTCGCLGKLAFARQGDTSWTLLNVDAPMHYIKGLTLHNGFLYLVPKSEGTIVRIELNTDLSFKSAFALPYNFSYLTSESNQSRGSTDYLVDIDGHLCLVRRKVDYSKTKREPNEVAAGMRDDYRSLYFTPKTSSFQVFKFDEGQTTWLEMESIGDYAIFVGNNHSLAVSTHNLHPLARDCIYFTDDCYEAYCRPTSWDLGVYNLHDQSLSLYYDGLIPTNLPQPTWVMPFSFSGGF